jgi:hypothetical protein
MKNIDLTIRIIKNGKIKEIKIKDFLWKTLKILTLIFIYIVIFLLIIKFG